MTVGGVFAKAGYYVGSKAEIGQKRTYSADLTRLHSMILIRSCSSNRKLKISRVSDSYLLAELTGFPVSAKVEVWVATGDAAGLRVFLTELGKQGQPWSGERVWQSLEGDFRLSATCTSLGNVLFNVELRGLQGATEEWAVTAGIDQELGQLDCLFQDFDSAQPR